ncbi:MAG: Sir2 silent information regulator family NAD-dependent deacetylase [Clostridia bacterium]|nr:Sir2 silent information regulator family NAD-dependent deacetylase [Clostridia bacterium]
MNYTDSYSKKIDRIRRALADADAVLIGGGAGLSASAGYTYSGERFENTFSDFRAKYGFTDMYSGGFYPYKTEEEKWAFWSRNILLNRYSEIPKPVYSDLFELVKNKEYFVLTTNVDHCFQKSGFDKKRLFYTQGDYGLFQCKKPCHKRTYDNEEIVKKMCAEQKDMRVPKSLLPRCPVCGGPMETNLRCDDTFVEDAGWHAAAKRYSDFVDRFADKKIVLLELGVGGNTPVIIKYPFWRMAAANTQATYVCINLGEAVCPDRIADRSVLIDADIGRTIKDVLGK